MIGKMSVFIQKWQKAKKRHGTYSKNYFICWDQNPKIENFEKKIETSITQKMDLIRNLKKWSKISSKHFLSRNDQFSTKLVLFDSYEWTLSIFFGQKWPISMKIDGARPRKRLLSYVYDMNLVRNVQKCSKMRSLKLKRKRGDWKSLKKVRKKGFVWRGIFFDRLDFCLLRVFSLVENSSAAHVIAVNRLPVVGIQTV